MMERNYAEMIQIDSIFHQIYLLTSYDTFGIPTNKVYLKHEILRKKVVRTRLLLHKTAAKKRNLEVKDKLCFI